MSIRHLRSGAHEDRSLEEVATKRTIVLSGCVLTLAACTNSATSQPGPPTFPDFGRYTAVDAADYVVDLPNPGRPYPLAVTRFLAPDGTPCNIGTDGAGCSAAALPGVSIQAPKFWFSDGTGFKQVPGVLGIGTGQPLQAYNSRERDKGKTKTLPPLHTLTQFGSTCGADDAGAVACSNTRGQAFVLSPAWSGTLDHATPGQVLTAAPIKCSRDNDVTTCKQGEHGFSFGSDPGSYHRF